MDDEVEGMTIALTPVQMAAVLGGQDVPESASLSNRLWGTVGLVGGVVELVGAGVLCLAAGWQLQQEESAAALERNGAARKHAAALANNTGTAS